VLDGVAAAHLQSGPFLSAAHCQQVALAGRQQQLCTPCSGARPGLARNCEVSILDTRVAHRTERLVTSYMLAHLAASNRSEFKCHHCMAAASEPGNMLLTERRCQGCAEPLGRATVQPGSRLLLLRLLYALAAAVVLARGKCAASPLILPQRSI
jgi:hypothetical protein